MRSVKELPPGNRYAIVDANVFIDCLHQTETHPSLSILKFIELGKVVLCTSPTADKEARDQVKKLAYQAKSQDRLTRVETAVDNAIDLSFVPRVILSIKPEDLGDSKILVAQMLLLAALRQRPNEGIIGNGLLVSVDHRHLLTYYKRAPKFKGLIVSPDEYRSMID